MTSPFIGEIRMNSYVNTPKDWLFCDGSSLLVAQFSTLYSVISTLFKPKPEYEHFYLPDLRGRVVMGSGYNYTKSIQIIHPVGETGGHSLIPAKPEHMPPHSHTLYGETGVPDNNAPYSRAVPGVRVINGSGEAVYRTNSGDNLVAMAEDSIGETGSGAGHENRQPYISFSFYICADGVYPAQN